MQRHGQRARLATCAAARWAKGRPRSVRGASTRRRGTKTRLDNARWQLAQGKQYRARPARSAGASVPACQPQPRSAPAADAIRRQRAGRKRMSWTTMPMPTPKRPRIKARPTRKEQVRPKRMAARAPEGVRARDRTPNYRHNQRKGQGWYAMHHHPATPPQTEMRPTGQGPTSIAMTRAFVRRRPSPSGPSCRRRTR